MSGSEPVSSRSGSGQDWQNFFGRALIDRLFQKQEPDHDPNSTAAPLRILIGSTPKTGNTWLFNLLSSIYSLPRLGLFCPFNPKQARYLGRRWITFHHMCPEPAILEWIAEQKPFVLTALRHPGDVLLSLHHHVRGFGEGPVQTDQVLAMLREPFVRREIASTASGPFSEDLACSLEWLRTEGTIAVRYEELRADPLSVLTALTEMIQPVPRARIEQAIERCDIQLMRKLAGPHGAFFRSGEIGGWRKAFDGKIVTELAAEPYASLGSALGYSLDPEPAPRNIVPASFGRNPFREVERFDNGVTIAPIIADLFLSLDHGFTSRWKRPHSSGRDSFFAWLFDAAHPAGAGIYASLPLPSLALYVYNSRPDLHQSFPNLSGPDRLAFAEWFVDRAEVSVGLDPIFTDHIRQQLVSWANQRCVYDRERSPWWPPLTNFASHVYSLSPDLQIAYPDPWQYDRWDFLNWLFANADDLAVRPHYLDSVERSLKRLASVRPLGKLVPGVRRKASTG